MAFFENEVLTSARKHGSLFSLLLVCIVFVFVLPVIPNVFTWLSKLALSIIIFLAASSISARIVVFGVVAILIEWLTRVLDFIYLNYLSEVTTNLFILWVVATLVIQIMKREHVTIYTLLEAVNGYLLLGIMFASFVYFVAVHVPGSFSGAKVSALDLSYYTFITLSTTGYGDIAPVTPIARSLALLIAITGQFYVAVIVAILVGKFSSRPAS